MGRFLATTPTSGPDVERWANEYNLALFPKRRRSREFKLCLEKACRMLRAGERVDVISGETGLSATEIDELLY